MCGRFALFVSLEKLFQRYNLDALLHSNLYQEYLPRYNIAPGMDIMAVVRSKSQNRGGLIPWGLKPAQFKKPGEQLKKLINARVESLDTKPTFVPLFKQRRCLVPANGFFEWHQPSKGQKTPRFCFSKSSDEIFSMAGLWNRWSEKDGVKTGSVIVTQPAAPNLASIHHRMPLIIPPDWEAAWLNNAHIDLNELMQASVRLTSEYFTFYQVGLGVNKTSNNHPDLIKPATER